MSDKFFDVVITGNTIPGMDKSQVVSNFAQLFKCSTEKAELMLSGQTRAIKKNIDHKTAFKYHQALRKAGVLAMIKPVEEATEQPLEEGATINRPSIPTNHQKTEKSERETSRPVPTPSLKEDSGPVNQAPKPDSAASRNEMTVAAAGEVIPVLDSDKKEVSPDISGLSMAEVGSDLEQLRDSKPELNPDTSHLGLGDVGENLAEVQVAPEPNIDLSALSVAQAGADLEELQDEKEVINPNTTHLSLDN